MITARILAHTKGWKRNKILLVFIPLCIISPLFSQNQENKFGILFYNTENLFDTYNDSLKLDDEFTPRGEKHWTYKKYLTKLNYIAQVIYESGGWNPPLLIGLCEVENEKVLNDLIWETGLNNLHYHAIHYESKDLRGIDVALLYNAQQFLPVESKPVVIPLGKDSRPTRDLLYVFGLMQDSIPLHLFVAHFPSRYGGIKESEPKRFKASQVLNDTISNILKHDPNSNIVVMGDFNDEPNDRSLKQLVENQYLLNSSLSLQSIHQLEGTHKHQFEWNTFDQFLVSKTLVEGNKYLKSDSSIRVLDFDFLLEKDDKNAGLKPFRTYSGYRYLGGYSDHLPIWLNLEIITP